MAAGDLTQTAGTARQVIVTADADALAVEAAKRVIARISQSKRPAICLTGGTTPQRLYALLGRAPFSSQIDWRRTHWFIGDERFVPTNDPRSNIGAAKAIFLDRCAPAANIHAIPTDPATPHAAAQRYERDLQDFYGAHRLDPARPLFDIVLMGVGSDGHTASLFPQAAALTERQRWVVGIETAMLEPFVPRVSLTLPALASCGEMLFMLEGKTKQAIFKRIQAGEDLPAARARSNNVTIWLVDRAAADQQP